MRISAKLAIVAIIATLSVATFVHMNMKSQKGLGQVSTTGNAVLEGMVASYIAKNMPTQFKNMNNILSLSGAKFSGSISEVEKVYTKEYLETMNAVLPIKLTKEDIQELTSKITAAKPANFAKTFSSEGIDQIKADGFSVVLQTIFVVFPSSNPTDFIISAKYSKRSGVFAPIVKEVVEKVCKKRFFGAIEECTDVVKRTETPRLVNAQMKEDAKAYLTAVMLNDIKENKTSFIIFEETKKATQKPVEVSKSTVTPEKTTIKKRTTRMY